MITKYILLLIQFLLFVGNFILVLLFCVVIRILFFDKRIFYKDIFNAEMSSFLILFLSVYLTTGIWSFLKCRQGIISKKRSGKAFDSKRQTLFFTLAVIVFLSFNTLLVGALVGNFSSKYNHSYTLLQMNLNPFRYFQWAGFNLTTSKICGKNLVFLYHNPTSLNLAVMPMFERALIFNSVYFNQNVYSQLTQKPLKIVFCKNHQELIYSHFPFSVSLDLDGQTTADSTVFILTSLDNDHMEVAGSHEINHALFFRYLSCAGFSTSACYEIVNNNRWLIEGLGMISGIEFNYFDEYAFHYRNYDKYRFFALREKYKTGPRKI